MTTALLPSEPAPERMVSTPAGGAWRLGLRDLWLVPASPLLIAIAAGAVVVMASVLLLQPGTLFSREMTWDLLFNLAGAWHLQHGHTPYVDFHDPLGPLNFALTRVGFWLVGPTPLAFLVSEFVMLAALFAAAVAVASRRLPMIAAVVFVVHVSLLVILPSNLGDPPNAYTFAMSYNRWCWSALATLCLLVFVAPGKPAPRFEAGLGGLLLALMFYLKVTFALAGLAAIVGALCWAPHVRRAWRPWAVVPAIVVGSWALPHNHAYLADIWRSIQSGYVRGPLLSQMYALFSNPAECAVYAAGVLVLILMWRRRQVGLDAVLSAVVIVGLGVFVLSQNGQTRGIPVGMVILFLVYDAVRRQDVVRRLPTPELVLVLLVVLIAPMLAVTSQLASFVGYQRAGSRASGVWHVGETNLRGISAPAEPAYPHSVAGLLEPTALRGDTRLSSARYLQTLVEGAALLGRAHQGQRVLTIDQVNALPFATGFPPPKGGSLWLGQPSAAPADEDIFADVDVVMIPKFSSHPPTTIAALITYGDELVRRFPRRQEIESWTVLSR